ncbi:MAG: hypothetical protein ABIN58_04050 [candidate division WOR-3 bacterium]
MRRYRQKVLEHVILVSQQYDGSWKVQIFGRQSITHGFPYSSAEDAKEAAHLLVHNVLEGKNNCDCSDVQVWEEEDW